MTRAFPPLSRVTVFYGKILETTYLGFTCVEFRVSYLDFLRRPFLSLRLHTQNSILSRQTPSCVLRFFLLSVLGERETRVKRRRRRRYTRENAVNVLLSVCLFSLFFYSLIIESLPPYKFDIIVSERERPIQRERRRE